jgi:hypothetical protein
VVRNLQILRGLVRKRWLVLVLIWVSGLGVVVLRVVRVSEI